MHYFVKYTTAGEIQELLPWKIENITKQPNSRTKASNCSYIKSTKNALNFQNIHGL